jgi:hypothetical protein
LINKIKKKTSSAAKEIWTYQYNKTYF